MASSVREHAQLDRSADERVSEDDCPECGGETTAGGGETVCQDCGLVVAADRIDYGPEWRAFDQREERQRSRTGPPRSPTMHHRGLGSQIGTSEGDDGMGRLRMWHDRFEVRSHKEQNLRDAFGQIDRITSALDLPDVVQKRACAHFREAHSDGGFLGWCLDAGAAACVFVAARECRLGVSLDDVRDASQDGHMDVYRMLLRLKRERGVELPPPRPKDALPRLTGRLDLDDETEAEARDVLETFVEARSCSGLDPRGIASMAIYVASARTRGAKLTQKTIVDAAGLSVVTLRDRLRDFEEVSET